MDISLLTTKLNIPPARANLVARPRLIERLQESLSFNLVLISAPAGFGKTTLLSEWARQSQSQMHTAWLSLEEGENDPVRFWNYFIAALKTLQPAFGESTLTMLHSPQPPPVESLLTVLINELAVISFEFALVLDDYYVITSQPIHDGITYLLEHLPPRMHLVIVSRADPPLPLARFRGKGTMLEIHTDDLRFTQDEAVALLEEMKSPALSPDDISALEERTEGWAVGLKMAALSLRHQKDIPGFLASFTGSQRYIMDYLMEEVLRQQTSDVQEFLLKTSVLERLTAPLCDAVTGRKDSHDILPLFESAHLFIVPLDESRQWYRYEHLFAELLQHQLELEFGPEKVNELHRLASQWYEDNNFPDDAIHHALAAKDWERAGKLITKQSPKKRHSGEFVTMFNWMQRLPEEFLLSHPLLCIMYSSLLSFDGHLDAAEAYLNKIEETAQSDDNIKGIFYMQQAANAYYRGDMFLAEKLGREALSLIPLARDARCVLGTILGRIYYDRGDLKEAEKFISEAFESAKQVEEYNVIVNSLVILGMIVWQRGNLYQAAEMYRQAIDLAGPSISSTPFAYWNLNMIFYEWNDLEAAVDHIGRLIETARSTGESDYVAGGYDILAHIRLAQGDEAEALKTLEKADSEAHNISLPIRFRAEHAAFHITFALREGDLATASKWGSQLARDMDALPFYFRHVPVRLLIAQGKKHAAAEQLKALCEKAVQSGAQGALVIYRVYQALAADTQESALECLTDALTMAEPEGYIRRFVDEGRLLAPLLRKAVARGIMPEYAGKLLAIIEAEERRKRQSVEGAPSRPPELLSEREIEVLRLLAEGLSNRQIAERLYITIGTAKTHVHNIIEKLYAKGRTQAISRARELKLI